MNWNHLANEVLAGRVIDRAQAMEILSTDPDELLNVLHGAFLLRKAHFGRRVRIHVLQNAKSGACPEDCTFCNQSAHFKTPAARYPMQSVNALVKGAEEAITKGARTYCMVTATRGPSEQDIGIVCEAVRQIKARYSLHICTSLGLLQPGQAERLKAAGVDRYNHNLESSARYFPETCTTHKYGDRVDTVRMAKDAGMEACCGGIIGLGEDQLDRVDLALALRELEVESVPVNLLDPRPGTPLGDNPQLSPTDALLTLAMFRFVLPNRDLRIAGGREMVLGSMQPLALYTANSMFTDGYLTTGGQSPSGDEKMILDAGFELEPAAVTTSLSETERAVVS